MTAEDEYYEDDPQEGQQANHPPARRRRRVAEPRAEESEAFERGAEESAPPRRRRRTAEPAPEERGDDSGESTRRRRRSAPAASGGLRRGWSAGQQTMDSGSPFAQALKLENQIQIIKFLEDEPYVSYTRHWVKRSGPQGSVNRPYVCLGSVGKDCPLCEIGDRPQTVSAFNVALVGDDGEVSLKTWDVGVRIFGTLKSFGSDPKIGPLSRGFFAVSKTGKGNNAQTNTIPIRASYLSEEYDIEPPSAEALEKIGLYDTEDVQIPKLSDLETVADELADSDEYS